MIEIVMADARSVASIMPVMETAFDPVFGEAWSAAQCMAALSIPGSQLLLAHRHETVVGFAISRWVLDEEELMMIGVDPQFQRAGIATKLLQRMLVLAQQAHRDSLFLEVRSNNTAISFYETFGFERIGRRKNYYLSQNGVSIDAVTMKISIPKWSKLIESL